MKSAALLTAAAGVVLLLACTRGPNPTDEITKALKQANLDEVSVAWDRRIAFDVNNGASR